MTEEWMIFYIKNKEGQCRLVIAPKALESAIECKSKEKDEYIDSVNTLEGVLKNKVKVILEEDDV